MSRTLLHKVTKTPLTFVREVVSLRKHLESFSFVLDLESLWIRFTIDIL